MNARPKAKRPIDTANELFDARLFRAHFDNLPGPAYMWQRADGGDFTLIAYNQAAARLPYNRTDKFLGMSARALGKESDHDLCAELAHCAETGTVVRRVVDHRYLGTDTVRRLSVRLVPVSPDIVVLHTDDVTERERIQAALRESEWKYRTIVDTAHEGIVAVDRDGVATYANCRIADMLGYSADELLGRSIFDFVDGSMRDDARRAGLGRSDGAKEQFDLRLRHKSGKDVWVSVASSPQMDEHGSVVGAIYMLSDISERKRTEQALQESEARYRALVQAIPDVILRVTGDGQYIDIHYPDNVPTELPRPPREYIGKTVEEIHPPDFAREHERHRRKALATGQVELWEYVRRPKGEDRHVEARFVSSGPDEVVITLRDITRRVELEREVITSTERERARIGHDLHDGLAQLLIGVKLLLEAHADRLEAEGSPHAGDARRAASLMMDAVSQTGELAQGLSPIRDGSRFGDALRRLAAQSQTLLGVACKVDVADAPRNLDQDTATHLYRIAQEAITNAVKHGKAKRLSLECNLVDDERGVLMIADDGSGIGDPCEVGGMGMHTMQYRARSIGGELTIRARPEGGTLVQCRFPVPPRIQSV